MRPYNICEKNFPYYVRVLPTIVFKDGLTLYGFDKIRDYYSGILNIDDLDNKIKKFVELNLFYRITDTSTHKNLQRVPLYKYY